MRMLCPLSTATLQQTAHGCVDICLVPLVCCLCLLPLTWPIAFPMFLRYTRNSFPFHCDILFYADCGLSPQWLATKSDQDFTLNSNVFSLHRVWCSKLTGPGVLLLGDAAHAVTPVGGQGANAALEDCLFLDGVLESTGALTQILLVPIPGSSSSSNMINTWFLFTRHLLDSCLQVPTLYS